jgi:hypothetical protein
MRICWGLQSDGLPSIRRDLNDLILSSSQEMENEIEDEIGTKHLTDNAFK